MRVKASNEISTVIIFALLMVWFVSFGGGLFGASLNIFIAKPLCEVLSYSTNARIKVAEEFISSAEIGIYLPNYTKFEEQTVELQYGKVYVDGKVTSVTTSDRLLYDEAVKLYYSGLWDGSKMKLHGQTIEKDRWSGRLIINNMNYYLEKMDPLYNHPIDVPLDIVISSDSSIEYVENEGVFLIVDGMLKKYVKGELIDLPGERLELGDLTNTKIYLQYRWYNDEKLYVYVYHRDKDKNDVYVVPDINRSEVKFVKIS